MKMTIVTIVIDNNIVIYSLTHTYIITYIYSLFVFFQMDVNVYVQCTLKEVHNYGYITKIFFKKKLYVVRIHFPRGQTGTTKLPLSP